MTEFLRQDCLRSSTASAICSSFVSFAPLLLVLLPSKLVSRATPSEKSESELRRGRRNCSVMGEGRGQARQVGGVGDTRLVRSERTVAEMRSRKDSSAGGSLPEDDAATPLPLHALAVVDAPPGGSSSMRMEGCAAAAAAAGPGLKILPTWCTSLLTEVRRRAGAATVGGAAVAVATPAAPCWSSVT